MTNQAAVVEYGGMVQLTSGHLLAKPQAKLALDNIIYTLTPPENNPQNGRSDQGDKTNVLKSKIQY